MWDVDKQLAAMELAEDLARQQRKREQFEHNVPVIHESLVDYMLNNTPHIDKTCSNTYYRG